MNNFTTAHKVVFTLYKIVTLIALLITTRMAAMEQSSKAVSDDRLLQSTIQEMSIGLDTALNGIRMPGHFEPEKHLALITELVSRGAPLNHRSHSKGTIFDTYWQEQKCSNTSCKEHKELFGKLLTAILASEANKATTRKEQRALYTALETKIEHLLTANPIDKEYLDPETALQILKKSAQGLPMPPFSKQ